MKRLDTRKEIIEKVVLGIQQKYKKEAKQLETFARNRGFFVNTYDKKHVNVLYDRLCEKFPCLLMDSWLKNEIPRSVLTNTERITNEIINYHKNYNVFVKRYVGLLGVDKEKELTIKFNDRERYYIADIVKLLNLDDIPFNEFQPVFTYKNGNQIYNFSKENFEKIKKII